MEPALSMNMRTNRATASRTFFPTGFSFVVFLALAGCGEDGTLCLGFLIPTVEISANYEPANGGEAFSTSMRWEGDEISTTKWPAAVANAARAPVFSGVIRMKSPAGNSLTITLPFPLVGIKSVPITNSRSTGVGSASTEGEDTSGVRLNYQYICTGLTRDECAAQRYQTWQGSISLVQASPLKIRIDAQVSYDGPRPVDSFVGELVFLKDEWDRCSD